MQTNTRLLKVTLSATGIKSEKHDIVLYCGKYKSVAKRILISVPDNKTAKISVPKLRKDLFNLGWQTRILKEAKKMFSTNLKDFHLVFISLKANKLPKSLWDKKLFPYVKNGGTLIVGAAGQFDFAKIFGNADYRLQWTGPQDYVATSYLKPGKWLNTPNPFGWETKQYNPPKSGFKVPAKSKWESLAIMRKKDGSTASYILEFKKGKGRIILTSGTLGIDRDGFMCRIALGSSRNNKTVKYLFNNLHRNQ